MKKENAVEVHLRNASLADIDKEAAQLESMYSVYRTLRKVTRAPGDLEMDFEIRGDEEPVSHKGLTGDRLLVDATRYRILRGIREHVIENVGNVQAFDLAFHLKCRAIPDELEIPAERLRGAGPISQ